MLRRCRPCKCGFSSPPPSSSSSSLPLLDAVEHAVLKRKSCHRFDPSKPVPRDLLDRVLAATIRSPTSFNLQPWVAVVVNDEGEQRAQLHRAALSQPQVLTAPVTVIFAGHTDPICNAQPVLDSQIQCRHFRPEQGPAFLRNVTYMLHHGPGNVMNCVKKQTSAAYSAATGNPALSVPTTMEGYAWKQAMIPVANFLTLSTAAGLATCAIEGIDAEMVRGIVGLGAEYTIPCIVSVGYAADAADGKLPAPYAAVQSPRFPFTHMVKYGKRRKEP